MGSSAWTEVQCFFHHPLTVTKSIFNQGLPKVSSTGLDLVKEVYKPSSEKQLSTFWQAFQEMWLRVYGSRLLTVAAINVSVSHRHYLV